MSMHIDMAVSDSKSWVTTAAECSVTLLERAHGDSGVTAAAAAGLGRT
jgi:hypothetical protein